MNDNMRTLAVINAIAIIQVHGIAKAYQYLLGMGFSYQEAKNVIDAYDVAFNRVLTGQMP